MDLCVCALVTVQKSHSRKFFLRVKYLCAYCFLLEGEKRTSFVILHGVYGCFFVCACMQGFSQGTTGGGGVDEYLSHIHFT